MAKGSGQSKADKIREMRDRPRTDPYLVLAVARDASTADIRKAYRAKAIEWHPDKHQGDKVAEEKFKEIGEAYSVLSDKDKRAFFDEHGVDGGRARSRPPSSTRYRSTDTGPRPSYNAPPEDPDQEVVAGDLVYIRRPYPHYHAGKITECTYCGTAPPTVFGGAVSIVSDCDNPLDGLGRRR